jgi:hypothetical protein
LPCGGLPAAYILCGSVSGSISDADLNHLAQSIDWANSTGRGVVATFGGTAFGDIALVHGPFMTNPKGIRDITEWYISTRSAANRLGLRGQKQGVVFFTGALFSRCVKTQLVAWELVPWSRTPCLPMGSLPGSRPEPVVPG